MNRERFRPPPLRSDTEVSAVYLIRNLVNGKVYVGSADNIAARWKIHRHHLRMGKHHSRHLQRAWDRYSENCFEFVVAEIVPDKNKLIEREQFWIENTKCTDRRFGYNVVPTAGSQQRYRHSPESRQKMSERRRGRQLPLECRAAISKAMLGIVHSHTARQKLSEAHARLSKEQVYALLDAYTAGVGQQELADQYGLTLTSVNKIVRGRTYKKRVDEWQQERGLYALPYQPRPQAKLTKKQIFDVYNRKMRGEPQRDIARRYDVSKSLISQIVKAHKFRKIREEWIRDNAITDEQADWLARRPSKFSREHIYCIMELREKGVKQKTIAERFGVTPMTICDIVKGRIYRQYTSDWRTRRSRTTNRSQTNGP